MTLRALLASRLPLRLSLCGAALATACVAARAMEEPPHSAELDAAIIKQAKRNGVPEKLIRRIVMRESKYNARARNHSFWGLMQISYPTAKSMGFKGTPQDLLNPFVNLTYAVPYLANAFIIAGKQEDAAVRLYASGYYNTAKQRGLLNMLRTADTAPVLGEPDDPTLVASVAPPPQSVGVFGALFSPGQQPQPSNVPAGYSSTLPPGAPPIPLPPGKDSPNDTVTMTADKSGDVHPPKKWLHDGGSTVIARGEQAIEQIAAYDHTAAEPEAPRKSAHAKPHKTTTFAAIDMPPATAQAYAATAEGQDQRLAQTASQAAIQQATSGQPQAAADPAAAPPVEEKVAEAKPKKKHLASRKPRDGATNVAKATDEADAKADAKTADSKHPSRHASKKKTPEAVASTQPEESQVRPTQ